MSKAFYRARRRMYKTQKQRDKGRGKTPYFAFHMRKKPEIIDSGAFSKFLSYCVQKNKRM